MERGLNIKSEEKIWNDFLAGNEDSFKHIYESSVSDLLVYGNRFSSDQELIKDCVQDLFVELHKKRSRLGKTDKIMPYLMVSLKRLIIKKIQLEKKEKYTSLEKLPFRIELAEEPQSTIQNEEEVDLLQVALDSLTARQREAIYLKYVQGFSYDELAKVLDLNYQTSRNLIYRAILKLRETLNDKEKVVVLLSLFTKFV